MISLLRRVWRRIPAEHRLRLVRSAELRLAPRPDPGIAPGVPGPVMVAGLLSSATGIGEGARLCAGALAGAGHRIALFDMTTGFGTAARLDGADLAGSGLRVSGDAGTVIVHMNAPQMARAMLLLGRRRIRSRRMIGYWAWELPAIPPDWLPGLNYVHEVWTPSTFVADAIRPFTDKPVRVVPHPVAVPRPSAVGRSGFGLPDGEFLVVAMCHLGSGFVRKNPLAAIAAFRRAFGDRNDVRLVVKAVADISLPWAEQELAAAVAGASNITLLNRVLSGPDQAALLACADAVMSLHRSEGFGLVLAEAMLLGRPVVATGWSGNLDFMSDDSAALVPARMVPVNDPQGAYLQTGQSWAEPDEDAAAAWLVRLAGDPGLRARMGAAAAAEAARRLGREAYAAAVAPALPRP